MDLGIEVEGGVAVVMLPIADLDASNSADLKLAAAPVLEQHRAIVFDLGKLRFVDSSGLGAFLSCLRKVNTAGGELKLCGLSKHVRSVFELVRMHRIFEIYETREEAVRAFAEPPKSSS